MKILVFLKVPCQEESVLNNGQDFSETGSVVLEKIVKILSICACDESEIFYTKICSGEVTIHMSLVQ